VLCLARKLVKDVVQIQRWNFEKMLQLLITSCPNSERPNFGFSGILGLIPKGPKSQDRSFWNSGRLLRLQKYE
jgi:hypothetical protein